MLLGAYSKQTIMTLFLIRQGNGVFCSLGEMSFRNVSLRIMLFFSLNPLDFEGVGALSGGWDAHMSSSPYSVIS